MKKLFLLVYLTATLFSDSIEKQSQPYFDTLSFKVGPSSAFTNRENISGGVSNISPLDEKGTSLAIRAVFNENVFDYFQPYVEFSGIFYNDRDFYIPSVGLRHTFKTDDKAIEPYISFGLGYAKMKRSESPVQNPQTSQESGSGASFSMESGLDYYISKNWALCISLAYNKYDIATVIESPSQKTILTDDGSLNVIFGVVYRFGENK